MDRLRLRKRLRMILAVGGVLLALAYLGGMANRVRLTWAAYRAKAELEDGKAEAEALNAGMMDNSAQQARRQGRMAEAEQAARYRESFLQSESLHRRKAQELLGRWR